MLEALGFFALMEAAGLAAAPLAALVLGRLPGAGLGFSKVLGLLLVGWLTWMAVSVGLVDYGPATIAAAFLVVTALGALAGLRLRKLAQRLRTGAAEPRGRFRRWRRSRLAAQALPAEDPARLRLWAGSEIVFAVAFAVMALLTAFAPDVWNTEKPMDAMLMTAIEASSSFPPQDAWMAGETVNYYYLGHLLLALPAHLLSLEPSTAYNLAVSALFALSASAVFTLAGTLWAAAGRRAAGGPVGAGLVAVALALVLGNLAGAREWLRAERTQGDYDWFGASRVIPDTINEFPSFSFTLGDLHAHVLAIPFTLLALGFALQVALHGPRGDLAWRAVAEALVAGLAVGALYAINSWSYPVAAGMLVGGVAVWMRGPAADGRRAFGAVWTVLVLLAGIVLLLPFWLNFDPAARGIGGVGERRSFAHWAGDMALIYGVLAWGVVAAYAGRLLAARERTRIAVWGGVGLLFVLSVLAPLDLSGVALLLLLIGVALHAALTPRLEAPERFFWLLVAGAALLLLGLVFPYAANWVRREHFSQTPRLNGLGWLRASAPGDVGAIEWLRGNAPPDAVLLEAAGPDYSGFGHARMSTFTGRPAVIGWAGHELQWKHDPGTRAEDVRAMYEATTADAARPLLSRYGVRYVVVGPIERADYGDAGVEKWDELGRRVFDRDGTTVWDLEGNGAG